MKGSAKGDQFLMTLCLRALRRPPGVTPVCTTRIWLYDIDIAVDNDTLVLG
jgi:hypothetical protein